MQASLTPDERLSVRLFLADTDGSEAIYNKARDAIMERHPEDDVLSHHLVKKKVARLTGIYPLKHDMCPLSCMAYTGPWNQLESCKFCSEPRYDQTLLARGVKKPRQQFDTYPLGPQLQARYCSPQGARDMRYRQGQMDRILRELRETGKLDHISDIIEGADFWDAVQHGRISDDDICLLFSMDGAQLYEHKASSCWIYIWILVDVSPDKRYKKKYIIPGGVVPGPNKPKHPDSFLFPGFLHIALLQRDGFRIWDAARRITFTSRPWIFLAEADAIGAPDMTGYVAHHGKLGCRFRCGRLGRRKPGGSHYYAVCLRPPGYHERGCDHDNYDPFDIPDSDPAQYTADLLYLRGATSFTNYEARRLATGLSRPSLFSGLSPLHMLPIPRLFPGDIMHVFGLNIPDLLYKLWHGTMECDIRNGDRKLDWSWLFLTGDIWTEHGALVAAARHHLPGSFDRPPRNPAEKISSGYKCWEYLNWFYGIAPALFYGKLPAKYWQHYCKLVAGVRIIFQWETTEVEREDAQQYIGDFVYDFEVLYVEGKVARFHFVPQCMHAISHTPFETFRIGSLICTAQFTMEPTIGDLGGEIRQPSNPFANLAERALRRARDNALKAMIPDLDAPHLPKVPIIELGDGFTLLHAREDRARPVSDHEDMVIFRYLEGLVGTEQARRIWVLDMKSSVQRWARLRLPNRQVCRTSWKEVGNNMTRISRNVKFRTTVTGESSTNITSYGYAEVHYFFRCNTGTETRTLAMVSKYGAPNQALLDESSGVVYACRMPQRESERLAVLEVKDILAHVAMIPSASLPHPGPGNGPVYFAVGKLGADSKFVVGSEQDDTVVESDDE